MMNMKSNKEKKLSFRLSIDMLDKFNEKCKVNRLDKSKVIRSLIQAYIEVM